MTLETCRAAIVNKTARYVGLEPTCYYFTTSTDPTMTGQSRVRGEMARNTHHPRIRSRFERLGT